MANITIASESIPFADGLPSGTVSLRIICTRGFLSAEGDFINGSDKSAKGSPQTWMILQPCTKVTTHVVTPEVVVPSTEDAQDTDKGRLFAQLVDENGLPLGGFAGLGEFRVPATPTSTTWEEIRTYNVGTLPGTTPHDAEVSGDLDVGGEITAAGFIGIRNQDLPNPISGKSIQSAPSVQATGALSGASLTTTQDATIGRDALVGRNLEVAGDVQVDGDADVTGDMTAAQFIGSAAGLHSFPGGAALVNDSIVGNASAGIDADHDANDDGEAYLAVGGVTKFRAKAGGAENESLVPLLLKGYNAGSEPSGASVQGLARRITGAYRGLIRKAQEKWWKLGREVVDARDYTGWSMNGSSDDLSLLAQMMSEAPEGAVLEFPLMTIGISDQFSPSHKGQLILGQGGVGDVISTKFQALTAGQHMLVYDGIPTGRIRNCRFDLQVPGGDLDECADSAIFYKATGAEGDLGAEDCFLVNHGTRSTTKVIRVGFNSGVNNEFIKLYRLRIFGSGDNVNIDNPDRGDGVSIDDNPNALGVLLHKCWVNYCNRAFYGGNAGMWALDGYFCTGNTWDIVALGGDPCSVRNYRSESSRHVAKLTNSRITFSDSKADLTEVLALPSHADQSTRAETHVFEVDGASLTYINSEFNAAVGGGGDRNPEILMFRAPGGGMPTVNVESRETAWANEDWVKFGVNTNMTLDLKKEGKHLLHGTETDQGGVSLARPNISALRYNGSTYDEVNLLGFDANADRGNLGSTLIPIKIVSKLFRILQKSGEAGMTNFSSDDGTVLGFDTSSNEFIKFVQHRTSGTPDIGFRLYRDGGTGLIHLKS
jgi:hypothetical protein